MGNMPLGWSNPSRVPCPPATRITPSWPAARASCPRRRACSGVKRLLRRVQPEGRRRPGPVGQMAEIGRLVTAPIEPLDQGPVDGADLTGKRRPLVAVQLVPERHEVSLAVGA